MRSREEHLNLLSEIKMVEKILEDIPEDQVIDKISLEHRLKILTEEAKDIQLASLPRMLKVTFRGKPVVGSEGFFSDFASDAIGRFTEAVKAVAAGLKQDLHYMGPIPGAANTNLMITGIAKGSFGFRFEVPKNDDGKDGPLYDGLNDTEEAIDKIRYLFDVVVSGDDNDDTLAEIVDEIHPRAVKKIKEFLDVLHDREALCAMEFNNNVFRFMDDTQLALGRSRLDDSNIHESDESFKGEIQGVLPKSRTFEFKVTDDNRVIRAKIGVEVEDPDILNREFLHKLSKITLHMTQVGQGQPRYKLIDLNNLHKING